MFSKGCEYGIKALIIIARAKREGRMLGIREICDVGKMPNAFTSKVLQMLVRGKLLVSQKGPSGGFQISKEPHEITLYDIVLTIDGNGIFTECGIGLSQCDARRPCPLHSGFEVVRNKLTEMCHSSDLNHLLDNYHESI